MADDNDKHSCPLKCPGCHGLLVDPSRKQDDAGKPSSPPLVGWRLVLLAAYAFAVPLGLVVAAVVLLTSRLGELGALGVGVAAAIVATLPGWVVLSRNKAPGKPGR